MRHGREHLLPKMANTLTLLGKAAAHRGRMSSEPSDLCPSCVVSVTYTASHYKQAHPLAKKSAAAETSSRSPSNAIPAPSAPALPARLLRRRIRPAQARVVGRVFQGVGGTYTRDLRILSLHLDESHLDARASVLYL